MHDDGRYTMENTLSIALNLAFILLALGLFVSHFA